MEGIDNNPQGLPELPKSFEEAKQIDSINDGLEGVDISQNWLSLADDYEEAMNLLRYQGVEFCAIGGIQAITGHKKNGKTFVMCQLMAAILNSESNQMQAMMPGLELNPEVKDQVGTTSVLYIDTEQEKSNCMKVARRVCWLCGWDMNVDNPRLRVLWLRSDESNELRWLKVKKAIEEVNPTAIFLDGVRDVISDFNAIDQSAELISQMMSISTNRRCCFWSVLHKNPGSEKMRGHLGTELGNKVSDTFAVVKKKDNGNVTFTVSQEDARGMDVPDWTFQVTEAAGRLGIPKIVNSTAATSAQSGKNARDYENPTDAEWAGYAELLKSIISPPRVIGKSELIHSLKSSLAIGGKNAYKLIDACLQTRLLVYQGNKLSYNAIIGEGMIETGKESENSGMPF